MKRAVLVLAVLLTAAAVGFATGEQEGVAAADEVIPITMMTTDGNNPYAKQITDDDRYFQEISRISGWDFSIEYLEHRNYYQLLTLRFASGDLTDFIQTDSVDSQYHNQAIESDVFVGLSDLLEEHGPNILEKVPESAWVSPRISKYDEIYGIPWLRALPVGYKAYFVREDWLEQLGMEPPTTIDGWLEWFEAVKTTDMNGDGRTDDEIPFGVRENLAYSEAFFGYFGAFPGVWRWKDGEMLPDIIDPKMKDAIAFWRDLYAEGYLNEDMFTRSGGDWVQDIRAGNIGSWIHQVQNIPTTWELATFNNPNARIIIMPGPLNEEGQTPAFPVADSFPFVNVINAETEYPEEVVKFLDWAYSDDEQKNLFFSFGIEGYNYTVEDGEIVWDPQAPNNVENNQMGMYQTKLNPVQDNRMNPLLVSQSPHQDVIERGIAMANQSVFEHAGKNMPTLETLKTRPELGDRGGSLFMDMFARVVTGREELDAAFDNFVVEWRRRGGDEAIAEATAWYLEFTGE